MKMLNIRREGLRMVAFMVGIALCGACTGDLTTSTDDSGQAQVSITIGTRATDVYLNEGDGTFSSLALYIFDASGELEYAELIPTLDSYTVLYRSLRLKATDKTVYAIGNYNHAYHTFTGGITNPITEEQLAALTLASTDFTPGATPMVGKTTIAIAPTSSVVNASVEMERLVSRLDVHVFKSPDMAAETVKLISVELVNQVTNSNAAYADRAMLPTVTRRNRSMVFAGKVLSEPVDYQVLNPENVSSVFYTYQYTRNESTPDEYTPCLKVTIEVNGIQQTFTGYISDATYSGYQLNRNTVYQIRAIINKPAENMILDVQVLPWTVKSSQVGFSPEESQYSLEPLNSDGEAASGIVQWPHLLGGETKYETSYANYLFTMTAPTGAVWTATLTNGLDFTFDYVGTREGGEAAADKGIARQEGYEIKVGARKTWGTAVVPRETYLYITVDGVKLKINPEVAGVRKFPGTETDILIQQTDYLNL